MNKYLLGGLLLTATLGQAQDVATQYAESITPADLKKHLVIIASDSLEGRDTGSPGQKKAAEYVAKYFKSYGLTPLVTEADGSKSYFQKYNLYRKTWGDVAVKAEGKSFEFNKDFFLNGLLTTDGEVSVPTVFAGYGIDAAQYNDYKELDVTGKAVVILEGEPQDANGKYLVNGNEEKSSWNNPTAWQRKATAAFAKGAKYVFMISEKSGNDFEQLVRQRAVMSQRVSRLTMKPVDESLSNVAVFTVSGEMGAKLLGTSLKKVEGLKADISKKGTPVSKAPQGNVALRVERNSETIETENIAAFLEGTDKKDEVLVISAHIDHIGISADGQINNGADDDGSGTVSLLELAEAFSKAKANGHGPRRSILFLNVTGEEKGLFGSAYYSENPLLPLANTVANLNIDMIGRVDTAHEKDPKYVYLIGSDKLSSELHAISEAANEKYIKYDLDYTFNDPKDPNRFYYRSDHYNFAKKGIPVIFYFTGVHEDYHRPGDDVEKIMFEKQAPIVQLVFYTAWDLTNREARIKVDSNKP
ncbi:M28 family peptidase [Arundinibacter roseus]|uniref:M28 family peptidase n=1 Tax=Arundinibacter roseus TaxID=2070510 RepID=A0A4R4KMG9_9BACT|nr:M28 family peptidase [Arundinibacter roseus]TDB69193.1 M28 family peptidase [Arundinibacter roseus]